MYFDAKELLREAINWPQLSQLLLRGLSCCWVFLPVLGLCLPGKGLVLPTLSTPCSQGSTGNEGLRRPLRGCPRRAWSHFGTRQNELPLHLIWGDAGPCSLAKQLCCRGRAQLRFSYQRTQAGSGDPRGGGQSLRLAILPLPSLTHSISERCSHCWLCPCCLS